jgi:hypothetical protein
MSVSCPAPRGSWRWRRSSGEYRAQFHGRRLGEGRQEQSLTISEGLHGGVMLEGHATGWYADEAAVQDEGEWHHLKRYKSAFRSVHK